MPPSTPTYKAGCQGRSIDLLGSPGFVPVCFAVYIVLRVGVLFVRPLAQSSDFLWYYARAVEIGSGAGYAQDGTLTAFWPVGWPATLAALFAVFGTSVLVGQIANLAFSALVFILTMALARKMCTSPMVGRVAALILATYPNQIGYVPLLSTEIFYECILMFAILLLTQERISWALLSGFMFGVATLTKTQTILLPGFLLLGVLLAAPSTVALRKLAVLGCAVYVAAILVIAPWTYRNYIVFDAFIPVSTNGGWTLLTGNNPEATGDYTPNTVLATGITTDPAAQVAMDRLASARAVDWIENNPGHFLALLPRKIFRLWAPDGEAEWLYQSGFANYNAHWIFFRAIRAINQIYYICIMVVAFPSIWQLLRHRRANPPWATAGLSIWIYLSLIALAFSGQSRLHFNVMPMMSIYAAWTAVRAMDTRSIRAQGHGLPTPGPSSLTADAPRVNL